MNKEQYKNLFENHGNEEESLVLNFLFVSLISSDTILTKEDAEHSIEELCKIKETLEMEDTNLLEERKIFWLELVENGIEICKKDIERMEEEATPEYQERIKKEREEAQAKFEANKITEEMFEWKEIHPNNIPSNPLEGYYALLFKKKDESTQGIKWSIKFQKKEVEPMCYMYDAKVERYNLFFKEYKDLEGSLEDLDYDVNDCGEFVRSYESMEEAKKGALARTTNGWGNITKENIFRP